MRTPKHETLYRYQSYFNKYLEGINKDNLKITILDKDKSPIQSNS